MENKEKKVIVSKDGPYLVSGGLPLAKEVCDVDNEGEPGTYEKTEDYPKNHNYSLCRCGRSANKPYCDGTHHKVGFNGTETASNEGYLDQSEKISGPEINLTDAPIDLSQWQVPPPRDWDKFERLCADLWSEMWQDHNLQRFGRSGQRQDGIDIFGTISTNKKLAAVQCKKKDITSTEPDESLTADEIQKIVDEAKKFKEPLSEFVIAYTGKRDTNLQLTALKISKEHEVKGLFTVHIYSWDDILQKLGNYSGVFRKHLPEFSSLNVSPTQSDNILKKIEEVGQKTEETFNLLNKAVSTSGDEKEALIQCVFDSTAVSNEHSAEIDHARDLIDNLKPKEALDYLEALEKRIWNNTNTISKFRILTNKAAALSSLRKENEAGKLFIQAYQYNPSDEKATCNRALGHLLLGQTTEAEVYAKKVLEMNPISTRAFGILINCSSETSPMEEIIKNIPPETLKSEDVAFALANATRQRGDFVSSIKWLETALESSSDKRKKNPDLKSTLGATILESMMSRHEVVNGIQLTPEDREKINKSIQMLSESIDELSNSESINYRPSLFANRATAYKLVGELEKAVADMAMAVKIQPDDAAFVKQYAFLLHGLGEKEKAIELLKTVIGKEETPEASYLLAGILFDENRLTEAEEILVKSFEYNLPEDLLIEGQRMLIHIYLKEKKNDDARKVANSVRSVRPTDIGNLIAASRIERSDSNMEAGLSLLEEANGYITSKTDAHLIIDLAEEFFKLQKYNTAWPLYEKVIDPRVPSPQLDNLLYSYYRSNEIDKTINAFDKIQNEDKNLFQLQIQLSTLENIGDLKKASENAELYLKKHPNELEIRVRLATHWFRMDEFEKLDKFLSEDVDIVLLPIRPGFQLAALYAHRKMTEKAIWAAYELRRANFNSGEAHAKYISIFLAEDHKLETFLSPSKKVEVSSAVCIKNDKGEMTWYLLEDRKNPTTNEIPTTTGLGSILLGKTTGESVVISEGAMGKIEVQIVEVKNKYVYALHESMKILPERFSEYKGFERFSVDASSEEKTKESLDKVLNVISQRDDYISETEKFYKDTKFTAGAFAHAIGKNIVDVWYGLAYSETGIKSCLGTLQEREEAFSVLKNNKEIVIDLTALLTLAQLDLLPICKNVFDKIFITQSSIDDLQEIIAEKKGMGSKGYTTISKEGDNFFRQEVTAEQIAKQAESLENLKKWIRETCEFLPCKSMHEVNRADEMKEVLGRSFLESMLVAKENSKPLYSEDFATRLLAQSPEFGVSGFWTQAMLIHALSNKIISEEEYQSFTIKLILGRYHHTTINGNTLLEAAKQSNWKNEAPLSAVLQSLEGSKMEIRSATGVLVDFLYPLWQKPILDSQREAIVMIVLDTITKERDPRQVVTFFRGAVRMRFLPTPLIEARVQQLITAWENINVRHPGI